MAVVDKGRSGEMDEATRPDEMPRRKPKKPPLTIVQILEWADEHYARTGEWPKRRSGAVVGTHRERWDLVNNALRMGDRGLPGGSSLFRLLYVHRGKRHATLWRPLCVERILEWADEHYSITGKWPNHCSGKVTGAGRETWASVEKALREGFRGLPGGSSLPRLLHEHRGRRHLKLLAQLSVEQVLSWCDAYYARMGRWPNQKSGPLAEGSDETWQMIGVYLRKGMRGLPSDSSLAQLLFEYRGVRNIKGLPALDVPSILAWSDDHTARFGDWPHEDSGPVIAAPGETWSGVASALHAGRRSLPGGQSLAQLLAQHRGRFLSSLAPAIKEEQILEWAESFFQRKGRWPTVDAGPVDESDGETWRVIDDWLRRGRRGLEGGSSVARLLDEKRGVPNPTSRSRLTIEQVVTWADAHFARCGAWPTRLSGAIEEAPGETWMIINSALHGGLRGLPGGSSLARLLAEHRGVRNRKALPRLNMNQIVEWADQYYEKHGEPPNQKSGQVDSAPGETWANLQNSLRLGLRGLPGGSSIFMLLNEHRPEYFSGMLRRRWLRRTRNGK